MARYQTIMPLVDSQENSFEKIKSFLLGKKFKYETLDGQQVFRKGDGFWSAAKFIRVCYAGNYVRLEAWVDAMNAEMDLEGYVACAAKKPLKKIVEQVERIMRQPGADYVPAEDPGPIPEFSDEKQTLPEGITKKEYIRKYAGDTFKRQLRAVSIVGYFCAGLNAVFAWFLYAYALIDVFLILGLTLGMHLGRSKGCAIALLVYSICSVVSSVLLDGSISGWLLLVLGVMAVDVFAKAEKRYKELTGTPVQKQRTDSYRKL